MKLSHEEGMGGQTFLEFLWKSLERMIWREGHASKGAFTSHPRMNDRENYSDF